MNKKLVGLIALSGILVACGGGGGGGGDNGGDTGGGGGGTTPDLLVYDGNTSPATITAANAVSFSSRGVLRTMGLTELQTVNDYQDELENASELVGTQTFQCASGTIAYTQETVTANAVRTTSNFTDCDTGTRGQVVNGTLIRDWTTDGTASSTKEYYDVTIAVGPLTHVLEGNHTVDCTSAGDAGTCTGVVVLKDADGLYRFPEGFTLYPWSETEQYPYRMQTFEGTYCDATDGCVTVRHNGYDLGYENTCGGKPTFGGLTFNSDNDGHASLTANPDCTVAIVWRSGPNDPDAYIEANWP